MPTPASSPRRLRVGTVIEYVLAAGFVVAKVWYALRSVLGSGPLGPKVIAGLDSAQYLANAKAPILSMRFLADRPFGYLLLVKTLQSNLYAIVIAQTLVSIAAWLFLAATVRRVVHNGVLRTVAVAVVLGMGIAPPLIIWDVAIMTDSLSISLCCFVLAMALRLAIDLQRRTVVGCCVALVLAAITRDSNAILIGVVGIAAAVATIRRRAWLPIAVVCIAASATVLSLSDRGHRWYYPTSDVVALRIEGNPHFEQYFRNLGLPQDGSVAELHDHFASAFPDYMRNAPRFRALRHWMDTDGRASYLRFLATHRGFVFSAPLHESSLVNPQFDGVAEDYGLTPDAVSRVVGAVVFPDIAVLWWVLDVALALLWVFAVSSGADRRIAGVLIGFGVLVVPHGLVVFHGDALEVARHALTLAVHIRVTCWVGTIVVFDTALRRLRRPQGAVATNRVGAM